MAKATKDILLANAKLNRVSDAEICFKSIESIYGQHHPNNRDIGIQLALGMGSMVYLHSQLKQPDTARKYYGKLQSLWENYPAHSELSWIVSSSMLHLSIAYGSIERYPEAMRYVDKLYELCTRQKYPADILQNYAFSILHLLYCFIEASEKKWALKYYNTFKELCEQHPGNKELMLMLSDAKKKYDTLHV
jgi:tetratricopeptide (TPR) repeat protein